SSDEVVSLDRDPGALVVEGIRRKHLIGRLMERVGPPSSLLAPREGGPRLEDLGDLKLSPVELRIARLCDGTRTIEDIVFTSGTAPQPVYVVLAALLALHHLEVVVRGVEGVNR